MNYKSTRAENVTATAAEAIAKGISADGGLFVPENLPKLSTDDFKALKDMDYVGRAEYILKFFLTDFTDAEVRSCVEGAYIGSFEDDMPAPLKKINQNMRILELWHGPTCAFKDLALQLLPFLLTTSVKKVSDGKKTVILVATSGDTGKAALEGFKDVKDTEIIVFYPSEGVSPMQKLQMDTQEGENVYVCAIRGNFDDAQTGVKKIFTDKRIGDILKSGNMEFSSANSINWGRLVPQIVYYISAYCDLLKEGADLSEGFNITVPTGNFGNILAAFYAKQMGVPVFKLICASNSNNVLTDFINTGIYDRNRKFFTTISPSMDILISSNLERLMYEFSGRNSEIVASLQAELANTGKYTVSEDIKTKIAENFYGGFVSDDETKATIKEIYDEYGYLIDTHTAVAVKVYNDYVEKTGDDHITVIASTASPYKFVKSVLEAVGNTEEGDEFSMVEKLAEKTGTKIPAPLASLRDKKVRFCNICDSDDMEKAVLNRLGL